MNKQDRHTIKALLQHMTDEELTNTEHFRSTLKQFNVTTTSVVHSISDAMHPVAVTVFSPVTIDAYPNGVCYEFETAKQAETFAAKERSYGDPRPTTSQSCMLKRHKLESSIIEALSLHHRIFSRKQIAEYVKDAQETFDLPDHQCEVAIDNLMNWQRNRIAARASA